VADDDHGVVFIAEEEVGILKINTDPASKTQPVLVDSIQNGNLIGDLEGITIYQKPQGEGYLIVSSQGDNTYALYNRTGNHKFLGKFEIIAGEIDGVEHSDGIDVTSFPLGTQYPMGMFIAQDNTNLEGIDNNSLSNQNFKMISWKDISNQF